MLTSVELALGLCLIVPDTQQEVLVPNHFMAIDFDESETDGIVERYGLNRCRLCARRCQHLHSFNM